MLALWFIPIGIFVVFASKAPLALAMIREGRGYDNKHPRAQQARLEGAGARALAAHQNTIEAFAPFAACLLAGVALQVPEAILVSCCSGWVACRFIYIYLYMQNRDVLRSTVWVLGLSAAMAMPLVGLLMMHAH